tara:strand:+ start:90 stop:392 length:303 start_codon:yes stop_codon:yes gene_type:complete
MSKKNITIEEVKRIADLSKLKIPDSELDYYAKEMSKIIDHFNALSKIDTSNIDEMVHISDRRNVMRKDEPGDCIDNSELIDNCPESFGQFIKVPRITDKE